MKLLQEIGVEIQKEILQIKKVVENINWQILKKKLVDLILDIALVVVNINSTMIMKFGMIAGAVKKEFYQKEGKFKMKKQVLIKINKSEYDLMINWGKQFVLMAKQGFIKVGKEEIQKSQQLLDSFESDPKKGMQSVVKMLEEKDRAVKKLKHKDHPYGAVGEVFEGE